MAWRIKKDKWPNGREFWTVENREENKVLIGEKGGVSRFHSRDVAMVARDGLNGKAPKQPDPLIEAAQ